MGRKETFNGMLDAVAKLYKCDSVECILLLDGVHNLGGGYGTDGEPSAVLRGFLKAWLCDTVLCSRHHIFPVCAMTSYAAAMKALVGSTTRHEYFFAPRLQSLPEGFPDEYSEVAEPYFWMTDGHGRVLEIILSILQEGKVKTFGGLLTEVRGDLKQLYTGVVEKTTGINAAMQAAVKRQHITAVQTGLGEWSLFTLERVPGQPETPVYAAPTFAWILLNASRCEDSLLSGYDFTSGQNWESFEEFVAWYRVLLSKVHGGADEPVSVAEFHRGVDWVKSPGSLKMSTKSLAPRLVYRCANQETTTAVQAEVETPSRAGGAPENTKTLGATFLNAKLASGADVFTGVEYDTYDNAYETIQCTHTSEAQVLHAEEVKAELEGCADPAGVFLLVSNRPWKDTPENVKRLEEACRQYAAVGLVHEGNFRDYFCLDVATAHSTAELPDRYARACEDEHPHRNAHRHRFFALDLRPPLVGTTTLGHDACARRSAVVVAPEAPARCASQRGQPAAASPCSQGLLVDHRPIPFPELLQNTSRRTPHTTSFTKKGHPFQK